METSQELFVQDTTTDGKLDEVTLGRLVTLGD
jgi:hypothetical protein